MQTTNDEERVFFAQLNPVGSTRVGKRCVEPPIERFHGIGDVGEDAIPFTAYLLPDLPQYADRNNQKRGPTIHK